MTLGSHHGCPAERHRRFRPLAARGLPAAPRGAWVAPSTGASWRPPHAEPPPGHGYRYRGGFRALGGAGYGSDTGDRGADPTSS